MKAARAMQRGGVGWYPHSGFMHMDTGPVRNWDLDHPKLVTLLAGSRRAKFNKKGHMVVSGKTQAVAARPQPASTGARLVSGNTYHVDGQRQVLVLRGDGPVLMRGEGASSVGQRLSRLRQAARAQFAARTR
jgi:hypothetical protein